MCYSPRPYSPPPYNSYNCMQAQCVTVVDFDSQPLYMNSMKNNAPDFVKFSNYVNGREIACPKCADLALGQYLGVVKVETSRSEDDRYENIDLTFRGECGHESTLQIRPHKGRCAVEFC